MDACGEFCGGGVAVAVVSALLVGGGRIAEVANMSACNRNVSFAILPSDFFRLNRLTENVRVRIFGVNVVGSNAALPRLTCLLVGDSSCSADALRFELAAAILGEGKSGVAPNVGSGVEWNEDSEACWQRQNKFVQLCHLIGYMLGIWNTEYGLFNNSAN